MALLKILFDLKNQSDFVKTGSGLASALCDTPMLMALGARLQSGSSADSVIGEVSEFLAL